MCNLKNNSLLKVFFVFIPLVIILILSFIKGFNLTEIIPFYNDEVSWYNQVMSVIDYGKPLGYNGYNGTHADIGTFGPWGVSIIYFMSFIPKILGCGYYILVINNLVYLCIANLLFIILSKPSKEQIIKLICVNLVLFITNSYITISMSECVRYSFSIVLAGFIWYLLKNENKKSRTYKNILFIVFPIFLLISMSVYIMFATLLPLLFYFIYKSKEQEIKHRYFFVIFSLIITCIITCLIYYINAKTSSPYVSSTIGSVMNAFKQGFFYGIRNWIYLILNNLKNVDLWAIIGNVSKNNGFSSFYLFCYYFLIILLLYIINDFYKINKKFNTEYIICLYMLVIFVIGFASLYTTSLWTYIRGINVAFVFVTFIFALSVEIKYFKKFIFISLTGILPFFIYFYSNVDLRINSNQDLEKYESVFSDYIDIEENENYWSNTVAIYGELSNVFLSLPHGAGMNYMLNNQTNENAKYVVINFKSNIDYETILNNHIENNHDLLYKDENLAILINKNF